MHQLAQLNIARSRYGKDDSAMRDFIDALDPVNATADQGPGFVWRLVSDDDDSPELAEFEASGWLVNMSVWESLENLKQFMTTPLHLSIMRRRAEWFIKQDQPTMVLWWVEPGHRPTFAEAMDRLEHLRLHGPGQAAFDFSHPYPPP